MTTYPLRTRRWTRAQYDRLIDVGILRPGDPVELIGGELMVAEPQGGPHYTCIDLVEDALREAFGVGWVIRSQGPVALDDESEPEPDVAVVPGTIRDYSGGHPARPVLVVEVSDDLRLAVCVEDRARPRRISQPARRSGRFDRRARAPAVETVTRYCAGTGTQGSAQLGTSG